MKIKTKASAKLRLVWKRAWWQNPSFFLTSQSTVRMIKTTPITNVLSTGALCQEYGLLAHVNPTLNIIIPMEKVMYPIKSRALTLSFQVRDDSRRRLGGLKRKKMAAKLRIKSPVPTYQTTRKFSSSFLTSPKPSSNVNIPPSELAILTPAWATGRYCRGMISD